MMRRPVTSLLVLMALSLALQAGGSGCASAEPREIVDAKRVTELTREADDLRVQFVDQFDIIKVQEDIRQRGWQPGVFASHLETLEEAERLYRKALEHVKSARAPRFQLAVVLFHQATIHGLDYVYAEESGHSDAPVYERQWRQYLELSNVEYRFFLNNLMAGAPKEYRGPVFAGLFRNYQYLGDHDNIVSLGEVILTQLDLDPTERAKVERQVQISREFVLKREMDQEEKAAGDFR